MPESPDSLRPPPKSEGHAGFVGAAIAMLLIGGGLVIWKMSSSPGAPEEPESSPAAKQAEPAEIFEDPPPPPPPPVDQDAGADAEAPEEGAKQAAGKLENPCKEPCTGKETGPLVSALRAKGGQARTCYERALRHNTTLHGRMTVSVKVGSNGMVCGSSVGGDTLGDPGVSNCVLQQFRAGTYPPPQGGCVTVRVPLNFVPKGK